MHSRERIAASEPCATTGGLAGALEDDLRDHAGRADVEREAHRLGDVGRCRIISSAGTCVADPLGHRRLDEARAQRERLDALAVELLVHRLRPADDGELRGAVDRQPRLARLAGDRGGVDDERVPVLGAGRAQHVGALAVEEDDRAQVEVELHVDPLRLRARPTGAPIPTPALLTSTSRRPKRSRWRATTFWISSSEVMLAATPRPRSPRRAAPGPRRPASRAGGRRR